MSVGVWNQLRTDLGGFSGRGHWGPQKRVWGQQWLPRWREWRNQSKTRAVCGFHSIVGWPRTGVANIRGSSISLDCASQECLGETPFLIPAVHPVPQLRTWTIPSSSGCFCCKKKKRRKYHYLFWGKENFFGYLIKEISFLYRCWVTFCIHAYFLMQSYKQRQKESIQKGFFLSWLNYFFLCCLGEAYFM